ncbi:hypothetical protein PInf_020425 [Phytophthora infestans]|nr:hypothetical protein PInf_020425 [Phytophthora infestans]
MATEMTTTEETETTETVTSEDVRALAREDWAGTGSSKQTTETSEETETFCEGTTTEMATEMTTTEETETTETVTSEDVRALAREDVSGDVTRSVAERGGYAVSLAVRQTTETSEETETFCRGYHYGNGHRDDHDGGNGNDKTVTSEDVRALAREDVSGDVTRSVAERGGYAVSLAVRQTTETSEETETFCEGTTTEMATEMTTTEETETTETVTSEDVRALAREDVSGDVTRSVAERGGYAWAGTGSSKQTTETSEETETFCRGYHYGNGHRDDHDGGNGNDETVTSEDVRALAREDWAGTGSSKQTTETSEETETFCRGYHYGNGHRDDHDGGNGNDKTVTSEDVRALAREDVSGDVTRSVAERGGYAVSSGCTSGRARDRASRQPRRPRRRRRFVEGTTTEMATEMTTTEETETTETVTSEDVRALAREDVSGDVTRSVAERGGYAVSFGLTSEDVRALAREDVSGDVTRSVAERGGYAVSFGCTSGAGTGSSKQTTETSEETETFWRGYHYGNGHRDDHDGGNGNDGDSDERGRESLGTRRLWLNAVATLCHLAVRVGGHGIEQADNRDVRGDGDVLRGYTTEMATEMTTTEETETTETVTSEDVRALAREDVSGDVTRSVAERGGYAVSSGCTSGRARDRASRQPRRPRRRRRFVEGTTTEMATEMTTTEETETTETVTSEDVRALAREDVSGDVTRSVAERGGYAVSSGCTSGRARDRASRQPRRPRRRRRFVEGTTTEMATEMTTTEETETTETVTSEDVRALAREDVSGDVTRSVAERGGYAVSFGCTSGAGTGSSKQTTETSEETETFCRGYHYGNGHRDDHDGGNGNDGDSDERGRESLGTRRLTSEDVRALAREDVSGDVTRSVAERGGYAVSSGCTSGRARDRASRQPRRPRRRRRFVEGTTTEMATEMTTTEETETTETVTSEDVRALAREDVSGDVTRSVAERGGYAVSSGCTSGRARDRASRQPRRPRRRRRFVEGTTTEMATEMTTTEETETTETVTSEDVRALAREDVSGDVTRSVAERGGYAVSSGCTSGAGTGSSKQTTETSEETETFCRGYHYGNGHRDDHDGGNGNDGDSDERGRESLGTRRREWRRDPQCG